MKIFNKTLSTKLLGLLATGYLLSATAVAGDCTLGMCGRFINSSSSPKGAFFYISRGAPNQDTKKIYPGESSTKFYKDADFILLPRSQSCYFRQENVPFFKYKSGVWWKFKDAPAGRVFRVVCK